MIPERLTTDDEGAVVDVLADAFAGYPVMRYVLDGPAPSDDRRLQVLVGFFVRARTWRDHPVFGIRDGGLLAAVATVTPPDAGPVPARLTELRESVWAELGEGARDRYGAFGRACEAFEVAEPHHHLNMIGVRAASQGRGLARPLLEAVHRLAHDDPGSAGVTLTTETPSNLSFYERFGYRQVGHAHVDEGLETWGFFRPR